MKYIKLYNENINFKLCSHIFKDFILIIYNKLIALKEKIQINEGKK
jgi:hypothetical protein